MLNLLTPKQQQFAGLIVFQREEVNQKPLRTFPQALNDLGKFTARP